jgi:tRNA pseudouridine55 synthase
VNRVQRLVRPAKTGHAGTLDPLATGVLVVAIGPATRLIDYVQEAPKQYRGEFLLGRRSDTEDIEGAVEELPQPPRPSRAEIEAVLPRFTGTIEQRPPAYSALKVAGKRAYDLARQGKTVDLAPRPVEIHALHVVGYDYPKLTLEVSCGSGTYIRSLGRDIAQAVGTEAVMSSLVRTAIGAFTVEDACALDAITLESLPAQLRSPAEAVAHLPQATLSAAELERIARGLTIMLPASPRGSEVAVLDEQSRLRAILIRRGGAWGPVRNFPAP